MPKFSNTHTQTHTHTHTRIFANANGYLLILFVWRFLWWSNTFAPVLYICFEGDISTSYIITSVLRLLHYAASRHFVSAGGALRAPGITLIISKGDNISKYVCSTAIIVIARKITKFVNF